MNRLSVIVALVQMVWRTIINVDRAIIHPLVVKWQEEEAAKKTGSGGAAAGGAVAVLLHACLLCSSCAYLKQGVGLLDDYLNDTQSITNAPAPVVTNQPTPRFPVPAVAVRRFHHIARTVCSPASTSCIAC
jgi:hypothetical protein